MKISQKTLLIYSNLQLVVTFLTLKMLKQNLVLKVLF